jgi:hypothetical protein
MDYSAQSVTALLRGPLITTPQGWVVIFAAIVYFTLAVTFGAFDLAPQLVKSPSVAITICIFWPFIVFLQFVKSGLPSFKPSILSAVITGLYAAAPFIYVGWKLWE